MATSVASAATTSLQVTCSSYSNGVDAKPPPRHGRLSLVGAPATVISPLKLVSNGSRVSMSAGEKKGIVGMGGPAALALLAAAVIPEIAEAAQPGISSSLKNLLLSVVAGGVVLVVIGGAVAAVSTFDPVKRK